MEDPESSGAAGPAAISLPDSSTSVSPRSREQQAFVWSRVHINPSVSNSEDGETIVTNVVPPPRSGAASVVVQDKVRLLQQTICRLAVSQIGVHPDAELFLAWSKSHYA